MEWSGKAGKSNFPMLQQLYTNGDLLLDQMVTHTYALTDLPQVFVGRHARPNPKGVIVF